RGMAHGENVVVPIHEEDFRNRQVREERPHHLHHFLLAVDALQIAKPGIARAKLRPRLLEDKCFLRCHYSQNQIGNAPTQRLDVSRLLTDPTLPAKVFERIIDGDFEHEKALRRRAGLKMATRISRHWRHPRPKRKWHIEESD